MSLTLPVYNNVIELESTKAFPLRSEHVPCFNPQVVATYLHESQWSDSGAPFGYSKLVLDCERENDWLLSTPTSDSRLPVIRDQHAAIVSIARQRGVKTLGFYGWPWVRRNENGMIKRCVENLWPSIALSDWVMPSFYWYGETIEERHTKITGIIECCKDLQRMMPRLKFVPFVSWESMKRGDNARALSTLEMEEMLISVARMKQEGLNVAGIYCWSMLARYLWLHWHKPSLEVHGQSAVTQYDEAMAQLAARGIDVNANQRTIDLQTRKFVRGQLRNIVGASLGYSL